MGVPCMDAAVGTKVLSSPFSYQVYTAVVPGPDAPTLLLSKPHPFGHQALEPPPKAGELLHRASRQQCQQASEQARKACTAEQYPTWQRRPEQQQHHQVPIAPLVALDAASIHVAKGIDAKVQYGANARENQLLEVAAHCNPPTAFVRSSMSRPLNTPEAVRKAGLPMGLIFQPMAQGHPNTDEVPSVDWGSEEGAIVRCSRCKAFINPFVRWDTDGRRWVCSFCGFAQATRDSYFCSLDDYGRRLDLDLRPELCRGTVDHLGTAEYTFSPPRPPTFLFLIDVSHAAVASGAVDAAVAGIEAAVRSEKLQGGAQARVGIVTFDATVHFHKLRRDSAHMIVLSDLEDLFLPVPSDHLLVSLADGREALLSLLASIPEKFRETGVQESCLGSAVRAAALVLEGGGKLLVCAASIPSVGELALKSMRTCPGLVGAEGEAGLPQPAKRSVQDLAASLARALISVDLFVAAQAYVDLASLMPLATGSGGEVHYYPGFSAAADGQKMRAELLRAVERLTVWEAEMKVRVSCGWKVAAMHGSFADKGSDYVIVPNCHADQAVTVVLQPEQAIGASSLLCVQVALLHTSSAGQRRIRVHTWGAVTTRCCQTACASVDVEVLTALLASATVNRLFSGDSVKSARIQLLAQLREIVRTGNLANSEVLQHLAPFVLGLLKSTALRSTNDVLADARCFECHRFSAMPVARFAARSSPRLVALHPALREALCGAPQGRADARLLSRRLSLSRQSLAQDGIYLLDNGEALLLWVGQSADPALMLGAFGVACFEQLPRGASEESLTTRCSSGNPVAVRFASILAQARSERPDVFLPLRVARQGDAAEIGFLSWLFEDPTAGMQVSYSEFVRDLGQRVPFHLR